MTKEQEFLSTIFSLTMVAQTVRMAVPYACAALGGVVSERGGIANIALEGMMLAGGLGAVVAHGMTGNPWWAIAAGCAVGACLGLFHGVLSARYRVDAIVSGFAINLMVAGGTRFLLRALYDSSSNSPAIEGFRLSFGTGSGAMLLQTLCDPITILTAGLVVGVRALLERTGFGLRLRGAGENPVACWNVGVPVVALRVQAVTLSGALGALGGVALAFDQHQFQAGMSGGRGFIALAAVIVGGWRVVPAMVSCLVFAFLDALQIALQDKFDVPAGVIQSLPYAATLLALVMVGLRSRQGGAGHGAPPAGLGKHAS